MEKKELEIFRGDMVWATDMRGIKRPYVVISNNKANKHSNFLTAIPLTARQKKPLPTHYVFNINNKENVALAEQIASLKKENVVSIGATLDDYDLEQIEKRVKIQLGLEGGIK